MDIDSLRSFIAFVDTGSFTRAAKQTFRSQSAISMQMKKLEQDADKKLFIKKGRNLSLTPEGRTLVGYARRILSLHDEVLGKLAAPKSNRPLIIGCPDDYVESVLPRVLELILTHNPNQTFLLHCENTVKLRTMLDQGDVDLAIFTRAPENEEGYLLRHDKAVWFHNGDDSLLANRVLPLVLFEEDCKIRCAAIDSLEKMNRDYLVVCTSPSATAIKALIKNGMGIGAIIASTLEKEFTIINDAALPSLPAVDIVLAVAPIPHPLFGASEAAQISAKFNLTYDLKTNAN